MPDRGLLDLAALEAPACPPDPQPLTLPGASWLQVTFEASRAAVLHAIPAEVSRPVPCYARIFVVDAPQSPLGPLRLAALLAGARYQVQPRNVLVQFLLDGPPPDALASLLGAGGATGTVTLDHEGPTARASVGLGAGGHAEIAIAALRAIDPAMLRWDAWLGACSVDGVVRIADIAVHAEPARAFLGKAPQIRLPAALHPENPWQRFRSLNPISACYVEGALTFGPPAPAAH